MGANILTSMIFLASRVVQLKTLKWWFVDGMLEETIPNSMVSKALYPVQKAFARV